MNPREYQVTVLLKPTPYINEIFPDGCRECGVRPGKFSYKQFGRPDQSNDFTLVRLGQVYLIRAEAAARAAGDWSQALPDTNIIRARAGVSGFTSMDADIYSLLKEVEKCLEKPFEELT